MKTPDLSGSLEGLKVLAPGDLARYKAAVTAGEQMGWGYYFPNLLSKNRPGRSAALLLEDAGAICIFLWSIRDSKPRLDLYLPPLPMDIAVLRRSMERANEFNGDLSARVMRIDTKDVDAAKGAKSGPRVQTHSAKARLSRLKAPNSRCSNVNEPSGCSIIAQALILA